MENGEGLIFIIFGVFAVLVVLAIAANMGWLPTI
jgi:hypothetical protein